MLFVSRNERGIPKAEWIASLPVGARFVTRRAKPLEPGTIRAVCPGRGKFAVARASVVSCVPHTVWWRNHGKKFNQSLKEAELEGFDTVSGWLIWYPNHKLDIDQLYRIEMVKL